MALSNLTHSLASRTRDIFLGTAVRLARLPQLTDDNQCTQSGMNVSYLFLVPKKTKYLKKYEVV